MEDRLDLLHISKELLLYLHLKMCIKMPDKN